MPSYTFEDKKTGNVMTRIMSWEERCLFLEKNPDMKQIITTVNLVRDSWSVGDVTNRCSNTFKDRIAEIKQHHHNSTIRRPNISET
jgi:hypothetical protein